MNPDFEKYAAYTINWTSTAYKFQPLVLPEKPEPEITDMREAQAVLSKIMSM